MAVNSTAVLSKSLLNIDDYEDVYEDSSSVHNHDLNTNLIKSSSFICINDLVLTPIPSQPVSPTATVSTLPNNQNLMINKVGSYAELRLKRLSVTNNSNSFFIKHQKQQPNTMSSNGSGSMSLYKTRSRSASMSDGSSSRSSSSSSFSSLFAHNATNDICSDPKYRKNKKTKKSSKNNIKKKMKLSQATSQNQNSQTLTTTLTSPGGNNNTKLNKKKKTSSNTNNTSSKVKKNKFSKLNDDYLMPKPCMVASTSISNFSLSNACNNNGGGNSRSTKKLKCLLAGDARVGKSALMFFFLKRIFQSEYQPTIVDDYEVKIVQNGESYTLSLFDTAGQEDWETLRVMAYPDTDVIILCFSVVRPDSMENIKTKWMPELNKYLPDALIILVGTQVDLRDQSNNNNNNNHNLNNSQQRHITTREGEELRQKISAFKYIECSALTQLNIKEVFDSCIEAYAKSNPPIQPSCFETLFRRFTKTIRRRFTTLHNQHSSSTNSSNNSSNNNNNNKNTAKLAKYSNTKESSRKYLHEQ